MAIPAERVAKSNEGCHAPRLERQVEDGVHVMVQPEGCQHEAHAKQPDRDATSSADRHDYGGTREQEAPSSDTQQAQARVQEVAQAVAQHVEAEHGQRNGQARPDGEFGRLEDVGLGVAQHASP